jgi:hypothetical protein
MALAAPQMSTPLATAVALALYATLLAPLAFAWRSTALRFVAWSYVAAIAAMAVYQTGFFQRSSLTPTDKVVVVVAPSDRTQCVEVLELMNQSGLAVDLSDPAAPKVTGSGADQLPSQVRDVLIECSKQQDATSPPVPPAADLS